MTSACTADVITNTTAQSWRTESAALTLVISGLPPATAAQVRVTGPNGFQRVLTASATLDSLTPGAYTLEAIGVSIGTVWYVPATFSLSTTLVVGDHKSLQVSYSRSITAAGSLPSHPRVWMTAARVTQLQAQANANTVRWQRVKAVADGEVALGAAAGDVRMVPDLCEVYLATGDARYATRAGRLLSAYAINANNLQGDSGYEYRFYLPLITMGLDWCYAGLTVAQRQQTATWLMNQADWVWPETNPSRAGAWGLWPSSNYYWGFMQTGPAALAAAGDDTVVSRDRASIHQQLALTHWTNAALPYFASDGAGGAWAEGTNYDSSWFVGRFADAFLTAGTALSTPWLEASLRWRLASTMPGFQYKAPIGDQPRVSDAPLYTYDRMQALPVLPSATGGFGSLLQLWFNQVGQAPGGETETSVLAEELLRYDPNAPAAPDLSGLAKDYLATGAGYFTYRQSWTDPTATTLVFEAGPIDGGHAAEDANGLRIWKGQFWVSADANIYSNSGIEQATENYNNLTIGGVGQNHNQGSTGQVVATQVSDQLVVVRGQAMNAYGSSGARPLTDYLRTVAYLPQQDVFVVVDRATAANPTQAKVWRWHMLGVPQLSGNTFTLQSPTADYRCFGSVLLPGDAALGLQSYGTSNAVTVTMAGRATDLVVTVLQCTSALSAPATPTATPTATATTITIGAKRVIIPTDDTKPVTYESAIILQ